MLPKISYGVIILVLLLFPAFAAAQGVGMPLLNIDFGEGSGNPGYPLPAAKTEFAFTPDSCPAYGMYTITNNLYRCPSTRMGRSLDHTPNSNHGYMMVFNTAGDNTKVVFLDTIRKDLCPGTAYAFSAYLLNVAVPSFCSISDPVYPVFIFSVETITGQVIQSSVIGPMIYDFSTDRTPKFHYCAVNFTMPVGIDALVLKIQNVSTGGAVCTFPMAMDNIQFASIGPEATIAFTGAIGTMLVKSVCYQDNASISFSGSVGNYYSSTAYQWQQSIDSGATWTDIPGATSLNYTGIFSVPDTFLIRLSAGETSKIGNINCRVVSNVLKVEVNGIPTNITATSNSPVCAGKELRMEATGGTYFEWHGPDGFYDNIAKPHIYSSSLKDSGMYYVTVSSTGGCSAEDSVYVRIVGQEVTAGPDTAICMGNSVQLQTVTGKTYSWTPAAGLSASTSKNPLATPQTSTVYTVTVTDGYGCSDTAMVNIKLRNKKEVKAMIGGTPYLCRPYDSLILQNKSTGDIIHWRWNFGNGVIADTAQPSVQYYNIPDQRDGYTVMLTVADSAGCTDTAYYNITAVSNCYIAVPGAFTPNGDGLNDYLYPLNAYKATELRFMVYNRKGLLLYATKDWTKKWDGTYNGEPQDPGTYAWILQYRNEAGKKILLKGTTVLLR